MKLLVIQNEILTILNFNHLEYFIFIEKKTIFTNGNKTEVQQLEEEIQKQQEIRNNAHTIQKLQKCLFTIEKEFKLSELKWISYGKININNVTLKFPKEQIEFVFFEDKQREEFKINLIKNLENNPMLSKQYQ